MPTSEELSRLRSLIRVVPDYPAPGVQFQDITPLLADAQALRTAAAAMVEPFAGRYDLVAGIEARGFIFAAAAAALTGTGFVPLRKAGKLPAPAASVSYELEYGSATLEAGDQITEGARVLLVDDVLATGGTLRAGNALIEKLGGTVVGNSVLMHLRFLEGSVSCPDTAAVFTL